MEMLLHVLYLILSRVLNSLRCRYIKLKFWYSCVQIEWLTAGECIAGMHEVVVTSKTKDAIKLAKEQNRSLWRVSSTVSLLNQCPFKFS